MVTDARRQGGMTYLGVLLAVAILGTGLAATGTVWQTARRQDNEKELLFVGNEFRQAIEAYYLRTPGPVKQYPPSLEALLQDPRLPTVERYLRRIYRDPVTNSSDWGLVRAPEGGIAGVFSLSAERPLKEAGFSPRDEGFAKAPKYSDWRFVYMPSLAGGLVPPPAPAAVPGAADAPGMTLPPPAAAADDAPGMTLPPPAGTPDSPGGTPALQAPPIAQ